MTNKITFSFPYASVLGLIFIALKLAEVGQIATWSWLWVLSPFWLPFALIMTIIAGAGVFALLVATIAFIVGLFVK